ncbi:MAG: hypothetical protein WC575_00945 [Patescibacteria group bacterium]
MTHSKIVYISGTLTDLTEEERIKLRQFYEDLGSICSKFGFTPYIPHFHSDPLHTLTQRNFDRIERLAVTQSYLVIAYVGIDSTKVGIIIEMAYHANKPTVLIYKRKQRDGLISQSVCGNPGVVHQIEFDEEVGGFENAKKQLSKFLHEFRSSNVADGLPNIISL